MNFLETLEYAKGQMNLDPRLAAYMVRDFPELEEMGLSNLALALSRANHVSHSDAKLLFELIDKWLNERTNQALPKPSHWYSVERASAIAADLTASEEGGWTYIVVDDEDEPGEYAAVAVYDSQGKFVAYWNEY